MIYRQPALCDDWGVLFYGKAETLDGSFWWWTDERCRRHPLMPVCIEAREKTDG